jgi:hypothetical protein
VFYDCLEEVVDESFSEQEDNYFQEEPRKSEVDKCYYEVFVNNNNINDNNGNSNNEDDTSDTESNDFNDDNEESKVDSEEEDESEEE